MQKRILIANRGEIARRIIKTINRLGHISVGLKLKSDKVPFYLKEANEVIAFNSESPQETFLNEKLIVKLALEHRIDLIHPGYGFLSESSEFAKAVEEAKLIYIGPSSYTLDVLGDKVKAKLLANENKIPVIRGFNIKSGDLDIKDLSEKAVEIGFPLIIKAGAGGGGRGMRVSYNLDSLLESIPAARIEAKRNFGSEELFIEKFLEDVRHVEVQVIGDKLGSLIHLFERDCSLQRKFQKVIEIAPAYGLDEKIKENLYSCSLNLAKAGKLTNAATFEFLLEKSSNNFYFIEANPRLQVEHTITEEITGLDIVELQIKSALGLALPEQKSIVQSGYAVQARVCAECPEDNFTPSAGRIESWEITNIGTYEDLRFDLAYDIREEVGTNFDSLIGKIIVHSESLENCFNKLTNQTLNFATPFGLQSNTAFLIKLLEEAKDYKKVHTRWIEASFLDSYNKYYKDLLAILSRNSIEIYKSNFNGDGLFSKSILRPKVFSLPNLDLKINGETLNILDPQDIEILTSELYILDSNHSDDVSGIFKGVPFTLGPKMALDETSHTASKGTLDIIAPLPGTVINFNHKEGDLVRAGATLLSIESMKTEHKLSAKSDCIIESINIQLGYQAKKGEVLISCKPIPNEEKI